MKSKLVWLLMLMVLVSGCTTPKTELDIMFDEHEKKMNKYIKEFLEQKKDGNLSAAKKTMTQANMEFKAFNKRYQQKIENFDKETLAKIYQRLNKRYIDLAKKTDVFL